MHKIIMPKTENNNKAIRMIIENIANFECFSPKIYFVYYHQHVLPIYVPNHIKRRHRLQYDTQL